MKRPFPSDANFRPLMLSLPDNPCRVDSSTHSHVQMEESTSSSASVTLGRFVEEATRTGPPIWHHLPVPLQLETPRYVGNLSGRYFLRAPDCIM